MTQETYDAREIWFKQRIGERVFRNKTTCPCKSCTNVYENGLVIEDGYHATYLHDCEAEFTACGNPLRYFDDQKEAQNYPNV